MKNNKNDTIKKRAYCPLCGTPCAVKGDPKKGSLYYKPTAPTKAAINELQADIDALKLRIKQLDAEKAALKKKQNRQIAPLKWEVNGTGTFAAAHFGELTCHIAQIVGGLFRFRLTSPRDRLPRSMPEAQMQVEELLSKIVSALTAKGGVK